MWSALKIIFIGIISIQVCWYPPLKRFRIVLEEEKCVLDAGGGDASVPSRQDVATVHRGAFPSAKSGQWSGGFERYLATSCMHSAIARGRGKEGHKAPSCATCYLNFLLFQKLFWFMCWSSIFEKLFVVIFAFFSNVCW